MLYDRVSPLHFILFLFECKHRCKWIQRCRRLRLRLFHIGHLDRRRLVGATLGYTALIGRHSRADFTANVSDSAAFIFESIEVTSIMLKILLLDSVFEAQHQDVAFQLDLLLSQVLIVQVI